MPTIADLLQTFGIVLITGGVVLTAIAVDAFIRLRPYKRKLYPWEDLLVLPHWMEAFQYGVPAAWMIVVGTLIFIIV